jgi:hypothetical protein
MERYEVGGRTFVVGQVVDCYVPARDAWVTCRVLPHLPKSLPSLRENTVRVSWWYEPGSACGGPSGKWGHAYFRPGRVRGYPHGDFA